MQGFSAVWWNDKHFRHHALPNGSVRGRDGAFQAFDEDVDTAPLLLWIPHLASTCSDKALASWIPYQHAYMLPLLCLSKFAWNVRSMQICLLQHKYAHVFVSLLHYVVFLGIGTMAAASFLTAVAWYCMGMLSGGFLLAFVFVQSHNGMEAPRGSSKGFYTTQLETTRNNSTDAFTTWFTGGLNHQIEHHMFPRLPRHNFGMVREHVRVLAEEHGLRYEELGVLESTRRVLTHLRSVGRASASQEM